MELLHQPEEIIAQRYRILSTLGQGGVGITYQAEDLQNSQQVALKALSLRRMADWKVLELFEREARILSELNHPGIPHYLDYFQVDTVEDRSFYIVQQLAPGKSLAALVESGWKPDEALVKSLTIQILEILVYLHSLTPPVIHRDIKPQNIILGKNKQVFLVDFGAVQDTYHNTVTGGSTVVGTYGYMAPEQFRGQAVLSTDLYGLGTTLLFLLTGKSPADLPQRKLKINFRSHISVSSEFADWLEKTISPVIEDRFSSAKEALSVLRGEVLISTLFWAKPHKPKYSPITSIETNNQLKIKIPPAWLRNYHSLFFGIVPIIGYGFFCLALFLISIETYLNNVTVPFVLFLLVYFGMIGLFIVLLIGLKIPGRFLFRGLFRTNLEIGLENFQIRFSLLGGRSEIRGRTKDIVQGKLCNIKLPLSKKPFTFCLLQERVRKHRFGLFLTEEENEWLLEEIREFLKKVR